MKSLYAKIGAFLLTAGLLSACGGQAVATSSASQAPADPPLSTKTSAPSTTATQSAGQSPQGATVSFTKDVLPILQSRCTNCHGGQRTEKGLNLTAYHEVLSGSENGPVVTAGNAADSQLVEMIVNQKMPKRGPKLTPPQIQLITDWVNQGALNN